MTFCKLLHDKCHILNFIYTQTIRTPSLQSEYKSQNQNIKILYSGRYLLALAKTFYCFLSEYKYT